MSGPSADDDGVQSAVVVSVVRGDEPGLVEEVAALLGDLVTHGAALGWVEPPPEAEIVQLLDELAAAQRAGDASVLTAHEGGTLVGFGYWRRYARPTHHPHADLEKLAVARAVQGRGVGRTLTQELIDTATKAGVEVLTLDVRGDNEVARRLYERFGFEQYGQLPGFVAVGADRYDKTFYALDLRRARPS